MDVYNLALSCLPENTSLKLDRRCGLYVARIDPLRAKEAVDKLANNGFLATVEKGLLTVTPGRGIIEREAVKDVRDISDHLYKKLLNLAGRDICKGETDIYVFSHKALWHTPDEIEFKLRRQAAVCMRKGCGGLLHAIRYLTIMEKEVNI